MYNSKGIPTNGLYGFIRHFIAAVQTFKPTHVTVCWDMGSETFRNELFPSYKANRSAPPEQLIPQFDLAKEVVNTFDVPNIGIKGYEADDCIGTITLLKENQADISILTGDHDMFQLLSDNTSVILFEKGFGNYRVETKQSFMTDWGIEPIRMIDMKAFMGDQSDNYPGVRGIGEKTALRLIKQYGTVEGVLANITKLTKAQQTRINENLDMLYLSRQLAMIKRDVPLKFSLKDAMFTFNFANAFDRLREMEIRGLERIMKAYSL